MRTLIIPAGEKADSIATALEITKTWAEYAKENNCSNVLALDDPIVAQIDQNGLGFIDLEEKQQDFILQQEADARANTPTPPMSIPVFSLSDDQIDAIANAVVAKLSAAGIKTAAADVATVEVK